MFLDEKSHSDVTIIKFNEARFDAAKVAAFKEYMTEAVSQGKTRIVLNLEEVKFMDSSALGAVVALLKLIAGRGELVLSGVSGMVEELFKLTRMDRVFAIVPSDDHALAKLAGEQTL